MARHAALLWLGLLLLSGRQMAYIALLKPPVADA